jgi:hypothetical protein
MTWRDYQKMASDPEERRGNLHPHGHYMEGTAKVVLEGITGVLPQKTFAN